MVLSAVQDQIRWKTEKKVASQVEMDLGLSAHFVEFIFDWYTGIDDFLPEADQVMNTVKRVYDMILGAEVGDVRSLFVHVFLRSGAGRYAAASKDRTRFWDIQAESFRSFVGNIGGSPLVWLPGSIPNSVSEHENWLRGVCREFDQF